MGPAAGAAIAAVLAAGVAACGGGASPATSSTSLDQLDEHRQDPDRAVGDHAVKRDDDDRDRRGQLRHRRRAGVVRQLSGDRAGLL